MKESVLYLEVDEDITSAIDKLHKTAGPAVQIVVPKRSSMLQSIINLKLLKKAAEEDGKELILVTNDRVATNLASGVGLAVAPSLGAKAVMAAPREAAPAATEDIIEADEGDDPPAGAETEMSATAALAASAAAATAAKAKPSKLSFSRKQLDDKPAAPVESEPATPAESTADDEDGATPREVPKGAITKVPSYNKLTRRMLWAGLAVAVIVGYFIAMALFTKAKVTLYVIGQKVSIDTTFTADPTVTSSDMTSGVLAAKQVTYSKDLSATFTPTGQKDVGTKATGTVTFKNCEDSSVYPFNAGNVITSQGLNFVTDSAITIPAGTFSGGGTVCTSPTVTVTVTATQNGDQYNLTNPSFTSVKLTTNFKITSPQLSGGTSKKVTVVAQSDIDAAQAGALDKDKTDSQRALDAQVPSGYMAVPGSSHQSVTTSTSTPPVDSEATTATLALKVTYTELAVKQSEYETYMQQQEQKQVGEGNQIYDSGLSNATITAASAPAASGTQAFHVTTTASAGPKMDTTAIAKSIAGKRYGDAMDTVTKLPGVTRAEIVVTPSWANSLPRSTKKITINIQVAGNK